MTLHITNGDAFTEIMRNAGIEGDILPWRDILHEGPVPSDASPAHFNDVRARFIAGRGWGSYDEVLSSFAERDQILAGADTYSEIVLWFDPDLYDQLQLVQVLSRLSQMRPTSIVSLVVTDRPGMKDEEKIRSFFSRRTEITSDQYALARSTWEAITSAAPDNLASLLHSEDITILPYLRPALNRYLEEFPLESDGLSRTERSILRHAVEPSSLLDLFSAVQKSEEHPFLGDTTFASYVERFGTSAAPLLEPESAQPFIFPAQASGSNEFWSQRVQLTEAGKHVLEQRLNNIALNGIDRHVGGVHLRQGAPIWYRNEESRLVKK